MRSLFWGVGGAIAVWRCGGDAIAVWGCGNAIAFGDVWDAIAFRDVGCDRVWGCEGAIAF